MLAWFPPFQVDPQAWLLVGLIVAGYFIALTRWGPQYAPKGSPVVTRLQVTCFLLGAAAMLIAEVWPIHELSEHSMFSIHMVEHMLYQFLAAPLFILGTPTWLMRRILRPRALFRSTRFLCRFFPAAIVFNVVIVVMHIPAVMDLTLRSNPAHAAYHGVVLVSSLIVWMPIVSPLPEIPRLNAPLRMMYLFLQSVVPTVPASFLTFGTSPLYRPYEVMPKLWGLTALEDQQLAGLIMKIGGGLLLWTIIAVVFFRWAADEDRSGHRARTAGHELTRVGLHT